MNADQRAFRRQIVCELAGLAASFTSCGQTLNVDIWDFATKVVLAEPNDATDYAERVCHCGQRVAVRLFVTDPEHKCSTAGLPSADDFKRAI